MIPAGCPGVPYGRETGRTAQPGAVIAAARAVYAEQGVEAPLDVIARRAEVGNATLYRRFPDRAALIEAVFGEGLAATIEAGERARRAADPWTGLTAYLERPSPGWPRTGVSRT